MNPKLDAHGVPHCTGARCPQFDGKRCREMGFEPESVCQPAVRVMAAVCAAADDLDAELYGIGGTYERTREKLHETLGALYQIRKSAKEAPMRAVSNADTSTTGNG